MRLSVTLGVVVVWLAGAGVTPVADARPASPDVTLLETAISHVAQLAPMPTQGGDQPGGGAGGGSGGGSAGSDAGSGPPATVSGPSGSSSDGGSAGGNASAPEPAVSGGSGPDSAPGGSPPGGSTTGAAAAPPAQNQPPSATAPGSNPAPPAGGPPPTAGVSGNAPANPGPSAVATGPTAPAATAVPPTSAAAPPAVPGPAAAANGAKAADTITGQGAPTTPGQGVPPGQPGAAPPPTVNGTAPVNGTTPPAAGAPAPGATVTPPTTGPGDPAAGVGGTVAGPPGPLAPEANTAVSGQSPKAKAFNDFVDTARAKAFGPMSKVLSPTQTALLAVAAEPGIVNLKGAVGGFLNAGYKGDAVEADPQAAAQATQGRIAAINNGDWGSVGRDYWNDPGTAFSQDISTLKSAMGPEATAVVSATNPLFGAVLSSPSATAYVGDAIGGTAHTAVNVDRRYLPIVANLAARTPLVPPGARDVILNAPGVKDPFAQVAQDYKRDWAGTLAEDAGVAAMFLPGLGTSSAAARSAAAARTTEGAAVVAGREATVGGAARPDVPDQPVPAAPPPSALGPVAERQAAGDGVRGSPPDTSGTTRSDGEGSPGSTASSGATSGIAGTSGSTSSGGSTSTGGTSGAAGTSGQPLAKGSDSTGAPQTSGAAVAGPEARPAPENPGAPVAGPLAPRPPGDPAATSGATTGPGGSPPAAGLPNQPLAAGTDFLRDQPLPHASTLVAGGTKWPLPKGEPLPSWYDPAKIRARQSSRGGNKFPEGLSAGPPNGTLYRLDDKGKVSRYAVYDKDGNIIKRVDLDPNGRHGSMEGPHATDYSIHEGPNGIKSIRESDDARALTPDEIP
jgi:hypothetical protein